MGSRHGTRERLLAAARDLLIQDGAAAVTMRAVATRVGLSAMAPYRHFPSREALLAAVVEQSHAVFASHLQRALAAPTPEERLLQAGFEYLNFALEHPRDYALMLMNAPPESEAASASRGRDRATFQFLVDRIRECADAGVLDAPDPELTALTVWGHVHGIVSLHLTRRLFVDDRTLREVYARALGALARGLGWRSKTIADPAGRLRAGGISPVFTAHTRSSTRSKGGLS